jgi:DNA-binding IclR family transcriptional regulator
MLPLLNSATGRIFLAYLPKRQTQRLVALETPARNRDVEALAARVRANGMAQVSGDHIPGLSAISAPVLDAHGEAAAAITLVGLSSGFAPDTIAALRSTARDASSALGWSNPVAGLVARERVR